MNQNLVIVIWTAALLLGGCADAAKPEILDIVDEARAGDTETPPADARDGTASADDGVPVRDPDVARAGEGDAAPAGSGSPIGPPATSKSQMSYIFIAHPDDEIASWSTIEQSSGNYHVFVLLTRGGHTGYCENPQNKPGIDNYPATSRDSEACKQNRIMSFHRFLNRAAATDPYLDVLDAAAPTVSDVDPGAGRFEVWAGPNSARVVFDFADGGLRAADLLAANELVRELKGSVLPDLPDYQALAASFWNAHYPDCAVYEHPDHRAVHVGVFENDLDTTVRRGRTCASDPDAVYFRVVSEATWRTLAGSPDFLVAREGDPGIYRESYGWLSPGWVMTEDESSIISRTQSFWQR